MPISIDKDMSTIEIHKDHVAKIFKRNLHGYNTTFMNVDDWLKTYSKFVDESSDPTRYVNVKEIKNITVDGVKRQSFIMEKVNVLSTVRDFIEKEPISEDVYLEIIYQVLSVLTDIAKFNKEHMGGGDYWINDDLHLGQFVITKDKKIMLLDPESFVVSKKPFHYKQTLPIQEMTFRLVGLNIIKFPEKSFFKKANSKDTL